MRDMNFKSENILTEKVRGVLIHAKADCKDLRTQNIVTLEFYFLKPLSMVDVTSDEVKSLINFSVMQLGYDFVRMEFFKGEPVTLDAEKMWKENNEQQSFQF